MISTVTYMLLWTSLLYLLIILAYYLVNIDKRSKRFHTNFLQGTWQRKGRSPDGDHWEIRYTFEEGHFLITATPDFNKKGQYKIIKELEQLVVLELSNMTGDGNIEPTTLSVGVDPKEQRIMIEERLYQRTEGE